MGTLIEKINLEGKQLWLSSRVMRLFANPARLHVLTLIMKEELNVSELERITGIRQPNLSKFLLELYEFGIVRRRKSGTKCYYRASSPELLDVLNSVNNLVDKIDKGFA